MTQRTQQGIILWFDVMAGVGRIQLETTTAPITAGMFEGVDDDFYKYPSIEDQNKLLELHGREVTVETTGSSSTHSLLVSVIRL